MKILVTGSSGFIGRTLIERLFRHEVVPFDLDRGQRVDDGNAVELAIRSHWPDLIVHLAAVTTVSEATSDPYRCYSVNVLGTLKVLDVCRKHGIPLIMPSTDQVYHVPLDNPIDTYATSKYAADLMARQYQAAHGVRLHLVRHSNVYGPGDRSRTRLIPAIIQAHREQREPVIKEGARWWLYVDDLVDYYLSVIDKFTSETVTLLGPLHSNADVAKCVTELLHGQEPQSPSTAVDSWPSPAPYKPTPTDLITGLTRTVEWWKLQP